MAIKKVTAKIQKGGPTTSVHKGKKGTTSITRAGDYKDVTYKNKKGRTDSFGTPGMKTVIYTSNTTGNTYIKENGKVRKATYKKGGSTGDKKWIQKAINPKHKGFCTPMTKATCTPKRKALAKTLKAMAKKK